MAAAVPHPSLGVIEEASGDAAGDGARDDEPPAAKKLLNGERDRARDQPGGAAPRPTPERNEHRRKEHRHHQVDTKAPRIGNQRAGKMTDRGRAHPDQRKHYTRTAEHAGAGPAFAALPPAN